VNDAPARPESRLPAVLLIVTGALGLLASLVLSIDKVQQLQDKIAGKESVLGAWTKLTARISADQTLELYVNGAAAAKGKLHAYIGKDPVETMQIGADLNTQVVESPRLSGFVGLIERVRIHHGELP